MDRIDSSRPGWRIRRWMAVGLSAGIPLLGTGCLLHSSRDAVERSSVAETTGYEAYTRMQPVAAYQKAGETSDITAVSAVTQEPSSSPVGGVVQPSGPLVQQTTREVPISLDTVFHLAEQHNPRIALARERLHESLLTQAQKTRLWLPNMYAGIGYFRHEGGIQDQNGRFIHSSTGALAPGLTLQSEIDLREATFQEIDSMRRVAQEKVSLSQVNNEVLLEAALTYIDLLTTRRGEAIARQMETYDQRLLDRFVKLAENEKSATTVVEAIRASLANRRQTISQLRQQGNSASAKLVYLLGLPPGTVLTPADTVLAPVELVDINPGSQALVAQAQTQGPGIQELEGILGIIQMGLDKSQSIHNLLPALQINAFEGAFGAGPGGSLTFDNRLDVQVQLRWNLTQLCQSEFQRTQARSKQTQALLNRADLQGKLAASVLDATETISSGREQIGLALGQIRHAGENYRLTNRRLEEGLANAFPGDVILSIRSLEQAHFNHLLAISAHNKAQIRLLMLLGMQCSATTGTVPNAGNGAPMGIPPGRAPGVQSGPLPGASTASPRRLQLPLPTTQGSPLPGGPDGSIIKLNSR